jgi:hypothetical protein
VSQEALLIGSKYRPKLSKLLFDSPIGGKNAARNAVHVSSIDEDGSGSASIDFDYNHGGSDGDDEQELGLARRRQRRRRRRRWWQDHVSDGDDDSIPVLGHKSSFIDTAACVANENPSDGDDEWELFFEDDEFETTAFFLDKENAPPKMPRAPTEPGPHVLESGRVIEQSVVDDFFMVATHSQKFMINGERVAMLETAFYDILIKHGWNDNMKVRFFRKRHHDEKERTRRKPYLYGSGTLVIPIHLPGHFVWVAIERQKNGIQIVRYFDSMYSSLSAEQVQSALKTTELWNEKTTWQNVEMPMQSASGMDCGLWACATLLRYLLFWTPQRGMSGFQDPARHITVTTAVDVGYFGREARRMVFETVKGAKLSPSAEDIVMQLKVTL